MSASEPNTQPTEREKQRARLTMLLRIASADTGIQFTAQQMVGLVKSIDTQITEEGMALIFTSRYSVDEEYRTLIKQAGDE